MRTTFTPSPSSRRSSCERVSSRPAAIRSATAIVGLVSPRSTWLSIWAETPLRSARSRSERLIPSRSSRTRRPIGLSLVTAPPSRTLSRTFIGAHSDVRRLPLLSRREARPKHLLVELADRCLGHLVDELHSVRKPPLGHARAQMLQHAVLVQRRALLAHHACARP